MNNTPDFTKVDCTAKLFIMYATEQTEADSEFVFTSGQMGDIFGCTQEAAINIIQRSVKYGSFVRVDRTDGIKPYIFKITNHGMKYGNYLQDEENRKLAEATLNGRR